jgi:tetratricopeptide (TPR) repeat protein
VKVLKDKVTHLFSTGRLMLLAGMLMLAGCAFQTPKNLMPPLLLHDGPEVQIADVDLLAVTPAMEAFLERYVLDYSNSQTRLNLLATSVTNSGVLGFDYDDGRTLTAAEAFETRSGNCLGFANMMIALARRAGLRANYEEVLRRPVWASREDTVLVMKHIVVVIESHNNSYVIDVSGLEISPNARRRVVDDSYAKALFLNNIGADALLENDLPTAYAYMAKAIETQPLLTDSWVNMGVVLGRNEQLDDARIVLQKALQIDPYEYSAMSNLYEVYLEQGDLMAAQEYKSKVDRYRSRNPYYLLHLSNEALELNRYDESISLLERAISKKKNDHLLHFAMAKTQYLSGETIAAEYSLDRARKLAPQNMMVYYQRPLDELIAEELIAEEQAKQDSLIP